MKHFNGLNLLIPTASNLEMTKGTIARRDDADFAKLRVDCKNDVQMVNVGLRQPKLEIDRSCFGKDKEILKTVKKRITDLREEFIGIIVGAKHPRMNISFIPLKE